MLRRLVGFLAILSLAGLSSCSSSFRLPTATTVGIDVSSPQNTTLLPGQQAQFSATVSNASNSTIIWEVNNIVGGNDQFGKIDGTGLYTAPKTYPGSTATSAATPSANAAPSSTTVTITAAAAANTSIFATLTVTLIPAPTVSVSPSTANVFAGQPQQFTASVTNSTNAAVIWQVNSVAGGNATVGTITNSGLYTAPSVPPTPATVTITAVSAIDAAATGSASVTVLATPVITLSPTSANVMATQTVQFSATVTNTTNTSVTWEVNGIAMGNSTVGTIDGTGLYKAPAVIPNPATVTVTAVSAVDPAASASAEVTITPLLQVVVSPPSVTLQLLESQRFTATSTIPGDTVTWKVNNITGGDATNGTITQDGVYMAPGSEPAAGYVTVQAYSVIHPTIFGAAIVNIGSTPPSVTVTPSTMNVAIGATLQFTASVSPSTLPQSVTWQVHGINGGNSTWGMISASGLYRAPLLVPSPPAVIITAISTAEPQVSGTATVTVILPLGGISVAVNPTQATLTLGQSQQFSATVMPNNNPNVTWSLSSTDLTCDPLNNPNACGGVDSTGNYTAPTTIPDALQAAHVNVIATSQADPTKSGSAAVTITASPAISITPSTATVSTGTSQMFSAQLAHVPSGTSVSWTLGCINSDEGDDDFCGDANEPPGEPEGDGPGTINATSGPGVTYTAPRFLFFTAVKSNACPDSDRATYSFVPLTASITVNGQQFPSTVCIKVTR
jgi:hypothetical protein